MNQDIATTKKNKVYGLIILAIIIVPMVLAYLIFTTGWGMPSSTTNKGVLLNPPISIKDLRLVEDDNTLKALYPSSPKKWRMLIPVSQNCDRSCTHSLYISRQVHIRLAEKAYRVERILLLLDELSPVQLNTLKKDHPETVIVFAKRDSLEQWLMESDLSNGADQSFYLIDQEGFAMMRYNISHTGKDLLSDIKKLLKFTYDK